MLIVADTSALIALAACRSLDLLVTLFDTVRVPPAVYRECVVPGKPYSDAMILFVEGKVSEVEAGHAVATPPGLGAGEAEAMALYGQLGADWLLVDDGRARRIALRSGIKVIGSLGALAAGKAEGHVAAVRPLIEAARAGGIYFSEELVSELLRTTGEVQNDSAELA